MSEEVRANREDLLQRLVAIQAGLTKRDIAEQSACFIFAKNRVFTVTEEIACRHRVKLGGIRGAVRASPLIELLKRLHEEVITLQNGGGELVVKGDKGRKAGIVMEPTSEDVQSFYASIEEPQEWQDLHVRFSEALEMVSHCTGNDESRFNLTCIHLHPKWIEACDNQQMARFKLTNNFSRPMLIRKDAVKTIVTFEMKEFSETESWMHFRNSSGLTVSCRRHSMEYPDLTEILKSNGDPATLPKGIAESSLNAAIFSAENEEDKKVSFHLSKGKILVEGRGPQGWYSDPVSVNYKGPEFAFVADPKWVCEMVKRYNDFQISDKFIKVEDKRFTYVALIHKPKRKVN